MRKLLDIQPGELLASGIFPGLPGDAPILWKDGENVIFDQGLVRKAQGHRGLVNLSTRPRGLKSVQAGLERRIFVGLGGSWARYRPSDNLTILESGLESGGTWIFTPWGNHVVANNQADGLRYWNGTVAGQITTPFAYALTSFKMYGHQFAGNTDLGANYLHWSQQNDYADWTPTLSNTAGDRELRDLDGGLISAHPLGTMVGLYTPSTLSLWSFIGGTLRFDFQANKVPGIGALSQYSVIPFGPRHGGLMRGRAFITDGVSFTEILKPAVYDWLEENVDWDRSAEVYGWHDWHNQILRWVVPVSDGFRSIGYNYASQRWTKFNDGVCAGEEGGIWLNNVLAKENQLLLADPGGLNSDAVPLTSFVQTKPLDCGDRERRKWVDKLILDLTWSGDVEVHVGFSDRPNEDPTWNTPLNAGLEVWLPENERREGALIHLKIQSTTANSTWKLNGFSIHGEPGGYVN